MPAIDSRMALNHMIYMGTKFSHIPIIHVRNHQNYPLHIPGHVAPSPKSLYEVTRC